MGTATASDQAYGDYAPGIKVRDEEVRLACPEGLEPPTCCLEGSCSIQLSYGQKVPPLVAGRLEARWSG